MHISLLSMSLSMISQRRAWSLIQWSSHKDMCCPFPIFRLKPFFTSFKLLKMPFHVDYWFKTLGIIRFYFPSVSLFIRYGILQAEKHTKKKKKKKTVTRPNPLKYPKKKTWHYSKSTLLLARFWSPTSRRLQVHNHKLTTPPHNYSKSTLFSTYTVILLYTTYIWYY